MVVQRVKAQVVSTFDTRISNLEETIIKAELPDVMGRITALETSHSTCDNTLSNLSGRMAFVESIQAAMQSQNKPDEQPANDRNAHQNEAVANENVSNVADHGASDKNNVNVADQLNNLTESEE